MFMYSTTIILHLHHFCLYVLCNVILSNILCAVSDLSLLCVTDLGSDVLAGCTEHTEAEPGSPWVAGEAGWEH